MREDIQQAIECWASRPTWFTSHPSDTRELNQAISNLRRLTPRPTRDELKAVIKEIIQKNANVVKKDKRGAVKKLMGTVMKQVRGKIDGKVVNEILADEIKKVK